MYTYIYIYTHTYTHTLVPGQNEAPLHTYWQGKQCFPPEARELIS